MKEPDLTCQEEHRRDAVRGAQYLSGLDFLEVSADQRILTVTFLGKAPASLEKENVRIAGGQRIRDIRVLDIRIDRREDPALDDTMDIVVDKPGDFSTYTMRVAGPAGEPLSGFDPRYAYLNFSFKANCPSDLDCKAARVCPPEPPQQPEINYLAKDYSSFRQLILDRLALIMPDWQERHVPDLGITLVEILAATGDYLSYYQDAVATEAYLETARQRISVRRHTRLVDYAMHEGCNARAWVTVKTDTDLSLALQDIYFISGYPEAAASGTVLAVGDLRNAPSGGYEVFEPLGEKQVNAIQLHVAHNKIRFYTWGNAQCCLPRGATAATLKDEGTDRALHLGAGDVLIFEEVVGPKTGDPADADPTHRHAVRLTSVKPAVDELYNQPVLEVEWAEQDALPFPLCISALGPPPQCEVLEDISVARGNVLLVDHGRTVQGEPLGEVPAEETKMPCVDQCGPADTSVIPGVFRPALKEIPLTFGQPLPATGPVSGLLLQDPRKALPQVKLTGTLARPSRTVVTEWTAEPDLLSSGSQDTRFVVEIDNNGAAHLRFGDGELGRVPEAGTVFQATYRVGNGPAGNVGSGAISRIVSRQTLSGVTLSPRNPLPATGGTAPEPLTEAKLLAPHAFRSRIERAITPDDYATLAGRNPGAQRAKATLRWTGSWYEALVAIDPKGEPEAEQKLLEDIEGFLYRFRRIGHDLMVRRARYVPLDVAMTVCVKPNFLRGHVQASLLDVFSNRVLPDGSLGFFHPDNLTFGEGVYLSRIVAAAQAVPGVESVAITRCDLGGSCVPVIKLQRLFEGPNGEVINGLLPLGPLEIARLDNDPSFPENGRIVFDVRGGR